jgi:antitoxin ParD1/3/4
MQAAEKLSITLPAEMVRVIRAKVEGGSYGSNSEVIREALRGWLERERHFATLDAAVDRGIADADAGRVKDSDAVRKSLLERMGVGDDKPKP